MNPLVSVIVPVYNVEKYLDRCVQSVTNQTYRNLEIILVDDGSQDNSPVLCDGWALRDNRIRVIHKQNAGAGLARNTGLSYTTGDYICFLDSDDYLDLTTIAKCVQVLLRDKSDAVLFGRVNDFSDRKVPLKIDAPKLLFEGQAVQEELLPSFFTYKMGFGISCCMKLIRANLIQNNSIRFQSEKEILSEDSIFNLEVFSKITSVSIVPENLYYYFKNEGSFSNQCRTDNHSKANIWLIKALEIAKTENLPTTLSKYIKARYHIYTIAALKQLAASNLLKQEKQRYLDEILHNPVLISTLSTDVLRLHKKTMALFFGCLKLRCHFLCKTFLYFKIKNS